MENLSIDFYSENEAAVSINWTSGTLQATNQEAGCFAEALLFACHTIRILRNRDYFSDALARALIRWLPENIDSSDTVEALRGHVIFTGFIPEELRREAEKHKNDPPLLLVPYKGTSKWRIVGILKVTEKAKPVFWLDYKGFGILGQKVSMFASDSVIMHLTFLNKKYSSNSLYLQGLSLTAGACANAYNDKKITSGNQEELALEYVNRYCRK